LGESYRPRRVGASRAGGSPPGTVRAPRDAYGSTSETAEGHILQRGLGIIPTVPCVKRNGAPSHHQAEVIPSIVPTPLPGRDVVDLPQRQLLQRQAGDGASVSLSLEEVSLQLACIRQSPAEQGSRSPFLPVLRQPWVQRTVCPLYQVMAEAVEA